MRIEKIMVIDDDEILQMIVEKSIHSLGSQIQLENAYNGDVALKKLESFVKNNIPFPDVIFLDINMPVVDGWQFIEELMQYDEEITKNTHIIICSSSMFQEDIKKSMQYSKVKCFVTKPLYPAKIAEILEKI